MNPLPPAQPLVLAPLPDYNPAQVTDWNALSGAWQTIATETANIPNVIAAMNAQMLQLTQTFNDLQTQVIESHKAIITLHPANHDDIHGDDTYYLRFDLLPMRYLNAVAKPPSALHYPPGIGAHPLLPVTLADATAVTGPESIAAIDHLVYHGAPCLVPFNPDSGDNTPQAQKQHLLRYLGVRIQ